MKLTVVSDVLGRENNGTTIAAMNLIRTMRKKGHTVNVVCPDETRRGQEGFYVTSQMHFGHLADEYIKKNDVVIARKDMSVLEEAVEGAQLIHVMLPFSLGKAAALIAHERGIALTAGFHCQAENISGHILLKNMPLTSKAIYRVFYSRLYRYCDNIHFPTRFIRDAFEAAVGPVPGEVISNGVGREYKPEPEAEKAPGSGYTLLYTGRYSPEKSHDVLINAVALSKHKDEIKLILAGEGPREDAIRRLAAKRGIPMPVMKFFRREEMPAVIRSCDLYVHAAQIEIESIACLEAIACGKVPLIADSPRSASRYFALTPDNLFRYDDPHDLARKIDMWLDEPEKRRECAKKYEGYARQFDFDACMDRMERLLVETEKQKHARRINGESLGENARM